MRVNLSFNSNNEKDKKIIEFLDSKYNSTGYIKEILYQLATGNGVNSENKISNHVEKETIKVDPVEIKEEFDEILGLDSIEL